MNLVSWGVGGILFAVFIWMAGLQIFWLWKVMARKEKMGGIMEAWLTGMLSGLLAVWILPVASLKNFWWLPLVLNAMGPVYVVLLIREAANRLRRRG